MDQGSRRSERLVGGDDELVPRSVPVHVRKALALEWELRFPTLSRSHIHDAQPDGFLFAHAQTHLNGHHAVRSPLGGEGVTTETIALARGEKRLLLKGSEVPDEGIRGFLRLKLRDDQSVHHVIVRRMMRDSKNRIRIALKF